MEINKKTFCGAPWFQIRNRQDMTKSMCCIVEGDQTDPDTESMSPLEYLNTSKLVKMRTAMANGVKVPECDVCWDVENHKGFSYRMQINSFLEGKQKWLDSYFKNKKNYKTDMVLMADIKIGNTCNFSCIMCNPSDSSKIYNSWVKQKGSPFVKEYIDKDPNYFEKAKRQGFKQVSYRDYIESIIENKNMKYIKLLGGEPLMDHKLLDMLYSIPDERKSKIELQIITNGSHSLVEQKHKLGNFKRVTWNISLEGIESVQEYARYGSNWATTEKHILEYEKLYPQNITILTCLQSPTITGLADLIKWTKKHNLAFTITLLRDPAYLSIRAVPEALKQLALESLQPLENYVVRQNAEYQMCDMATLLSYIKDSSYDKNLHKKFLKYISFYEQDKILPKFLDIHQQWRTHFEV
jgi:MoaA/NifB/PqqE/SkfB family radical SAM enzyme